MNKSDSIKELATALNKVQALLNGAIKDSSNPFFKSNYADLESVWESIRKVFTDNGLSISQFPSELNGRPALDNMLMHTSGEWICSTVPVISGKEDAQSYVAAYTYFRRCSLSAIVGQVAVDDDGNSLRKDAPVVAAQKPWDKPPPKPVAQPSNNMPGFENHSSPTLALFIATMKHCGTLSGLSRVWQDHAEFRKSLSEADFKQAEAVKDELKARLK